MNDNQPVLQKEAGTQHCVRVVQHVFHCIFTNVKPFLLFLNCLSQTCDFVLCINTIYWLIDTIKTSVSVLAMASLAGIFSKNLALKCF